MPAQYCIFAGLAILGVAVHATAHGDDHPVAELVYVSPDAAVGCPSDAELRRAVAERLGYEPFRSAAQKTVTAIISRTPDGLRGLVELREHSGKIVGRRELFSKSNHCRNLVTALELAITIAIDPLALTRASPPSPPSPSSPPPLPSPPPSRPSAEAMHPSRPELNRTHTTLRATIAAAGTIGSVPNVAVGMRLGLGFRRGLVSTTLEARVDFPTTGNGISETLYGGSLVPCLHYRWGYGCALGTFGTLAGSATSLRHAGSQTSFYSGLGLRGGVELYLARVLSLAIYAEVLATVARTVAEVNGSESWSSPPVSGSLGLALVGDFL